MPTTRARHVITETDAVERAIDDAAKRWPADAGRRGRLLVHLIKEGHRALLQERNQGVDERRRALREMSGIQTYPPDYLKRLREEWPE